MYCKSLKQWELYGQDDDDSMQTTIELWDLTVFLVIMKAFVSVENWHTQV